jgi:O-antigen/teichoic acid export membrane protein
MSTEHSNLAGRAAGAGAWTVGTRLATKLIDLAMLLCLARFLGPAEFGLVATAMAVVFIVEALFELPIAAALIRASDLTIGMLNTAFTLSLLRGLVIASLILACAWPLATFNNEPRLNTLLAVLALAPALRGLVSPRMVEYARAFNFRPDATIELSGKAVAFAVSVTIAVTTRSYWAIAAATVCSPLISTALSYYIVPLRPRLTLTHWSHFSSLIGWNFLSQLGAALNWQIDRLLLPRLSTISVFGQYAMGKQIADIPNQALVAPLARPTMAALASSGSNLGPRYLQLSHAIAILIIPVIGVPLLWSEVIVRIALGPAWSPAAEWLRWLSVVALVGLPGMLMGSLAATVDRSYWSAVRTLFELLVRLPLVWMGVVQFGVLGAIGGSAIATMFGTLISLFIVRRLIGTGVFAQVITLWRPLIAMIPAGLVLWATEDEILAVAGQRDLLIWASIFGVLYAFAYFSCLMIAWRLSGCPAGLEHHLQKMFSRKFIQLVNAGWSLRTYRQKKSDDPMEKDVKSRS